MWLRLSRERNRVRARFPAEVHTAALQANGGVLVFGDFDVVNAVPRKGQARLHADGSIDAQTTMKPLPRFSYSVNALSPEVTKIFSPLSTHSLLFSSSTARVRICRGDVPRT